MSTTTLNLLPAWRIRHRRIARRVAVWGTVLGVYVCALLVCAVVVHGPTDQEAERLRAQAVAALDDAAKAQAGHAQTMTALSAKGRLLEASQTVGVHPDWSLLLAALAELRGERVVLTSVEIKESEEPTGAGDPRTGSGKSAKEKPAPGKTTAGAEARREAYTLRLSGMAGAHSDVMAFVRRLEQQAPIKAVSVLDTRAQKAGTGELTRFELECRLRAEEAPR